jgi:8-oxo-dGTP diphosphatase
MKYTQYVVGLMFSPEGERVLMVRKKRPFWQNGFLNGPGGKVEASESAADAMVREFREETGLITYITNWLHCVQLHGKDYVIDFFRATGPIIQARSMTDEPVEVVSLVELSSYALVPNLRWIVPFCRDFSYQACAIVVEAA